MPVPFFIGELFRDMLLLFQLPICTLGILILAYLRSPLYISKVFSTLGDCLNVFLWADSTVFLKVCLPILSSWPFSSTSITKTNLVPWWETKVRKRSTDALFFHISIIPHLQKSSKVLSPQQQEKVTEHMSMPVFTLEDISYSTCWANGDCCGAGTGSGGEQRKRSSGERPP